VGACQKMQGAAVVGSCLLWGSGDRCRTPEGACSLWGRAMEWHVGTGAQDPTKQL
jgi:hypothetical protein